MKENYEKYIKRVKCRRSLIPELDVKDIYCCYNANIRKTKVVIRMNPKVLFATHKAFAKASKKYKGKKTVFVCNNIVLLRNMKSGEFVLPDILLFDCIGEGYFMDTICEIELNSSIFESHVAFTPSFIDHLFHLFGLPFEIVKNVSHGHSYCAVKQINEELSGKKCKFYDGKEGIIVSEPYFKCNSDFPYAEYVDVEIDGSLDTLPIYDSVEYIESSDEQMEKMCKGRFEYI